MSSLAEAFPQEQARVREVLKQYQSIGPAGTFGAFMIEQSLRRADQATASGDVLAMLRSYEELKGIK
jgi:N-glycosylase/DNA lyase